MRSNVTSSNPVSPVAIVTTPLLPSGTSSLRGTFLIRCLPTVWTGKFKKRGLRFAGGSTIHRIREQDRQKGGGGRASALHLVDARLRVVLRGQPLGFHVLIGRLISVLFL